MSGVLSGSEIYFDYTVIIEEGFSHGICTKTVDANAEPVILPSFLAAQGGRAGLRSRPSYSLL